MRYKTKAGQTILDVAAEQYGRVEYAEIICQDNGLELTDYLTSGTELELQDDLIRPFYRQIANGYGAFKPGIVDRPNDSTPDHQDGGYNGQQIDDIVDGGYEGQEVPDVDDSQDGNTGNTASV